MDDLKKKNCNLTNIMTLDCCRRNKSDGNFQAGRSTSHINADSRCGDSFVRKLQPTSGQFFIAFSSDRGDVAHESGTGRHAFGWFTSCVLKHLTTPGLLLEQIFKRANCDLQAKSNGKQRLWTSSSMHEDIILHSTERLEAADSVDDNDDAKDGTDDEEQDADRPAFPAPPATPSRASRPATGFSSSTRPTVAPYAWRTSPPFAWRATAAVGSRGVCWII